MKSLFFFVKPAFFFGFHRFFPPKNHGDFPPLQLPCAERRENAGYWPGTMGVRTWRKMGIPWDRDVDALLKGEEN